jgi:hypothetical protein
MLRPVANTALLRELVHAGQANTGLPPVEEQQPLDLLGQLELNYLPTLATTAIRNHAVNIGGGVLTFEARKQETANDPARRYRI